MIINLNLTHKNPELRELFNKKDFRVALSYGIDRQAMIDTALLGDGEPWQQGPFEDHPYFNKRLSTQYLEFKPDEANKLLDGIGLDKRGSDGCGCCRAASRSSSRSTSSRPCSPSRSTCCS